MYLRSSQSEGVVVGGGLARDEEEERANERRRLASCAALRLIPGPGMGPIRAGTARGSPCSSEERARAQRHKQRATQSRAEHALPSSSCSSSSSSSSYSTGRTCCGARRTERRERILDSAGHGLSVEVVERYDLVPG
ncbi:unnamed protein product [Lampetra fluviatilis]